MKVKIGDKIFNSEDQPIMIILSDRDKENIRNMPESYTKYLSFAKGMLSEEEVKEFMKV